MDELTLYGAFEQETPKQELHSFAQSTAYTPLPQQFTYPFHYTPHPLCVMAAEEVQAYITTQPQWEAELRQGKMFGVLVVQTAQNEMRYLAAFSGNLARANRHPFFVPPIYDLLQPDGFFKIEEENISNIHARIRQLQENNHYLELKQKLEEETALSRQALTHAKAALKAAKEARELQRSHHHHLSEEEQAAMIRQSQHQKAEFKRLEKQWKERIDSLQTEADAFTTQIEALKAERRVRSAALQQQLFEQFRLINARREIKNLCTIFEHTVQKTPPAGAGECAAPKLLQYAYLHQLTPIAMAEFWWGESPKAEVRHHGYYYPACKGKCGPILQHMLQGLDVEVNPLSADSHHLAKLETVFEDNWLLVVNKPEGMLSVPGKEETDSVYKRVKAQYPEATGPMIVHRLDMATSGLLLLAKTKEVHQHLQAQFKNRTIKKRYIALLNGVIPSPEGIIDLPLSPNPLDRPRQIVDPESGKPAITSYRVLEQKEAQTRIAFFPLTGRTHQLRVHAAHPLGLNCPIVGDELYGRKADRLYLHAEQLEFIHPISGLNVCIEKKSDF